MRHLMIVAGAALILMAAGSTPATAAPAGRTGSLQVRIAAPDGVPATVSLAGPTPVVASKPPAGKLAIVALTVSPGAYTVRSPDVEYGGRRYVAHASRRVIRVGGRPDRVPVTVTYVFDGAAYDLHAEAITANSISLAWSAAAGTRFALRRTAGTTPATVRTPGVGLSIRGKSAVDKGLRAGRRYTYSLFTKVRGRWRGPFTVTVATTSKDGVSYLANPATLLAQTSDLVSAAPTGSGVEVVLRDDVAAPLPGAAVVLPVTDALPGGYLGVVTSVGADGHTLELRAGGLIDAFDYYELSVDQFAMTAALGKSAAAAASCKDQGGTTVTLASTVVLSGHFATKVSRSKLLSLPTGASLDLGLSADIKGSASLKTSGGTSCEVDLPKLTHQLTAGPVPMAVTFTPVADFDISASAEISNVGVEATAGVNVKGTMSVTDGASFSGATDLKVNPLSPTVKANGSVAVKIGGELLLGPGVTTEKAGVTAGVNGSLIPLDASFKPHFGIEDQRFNACTDIDAAFTRSLGLAAQAWLGDTWKFDKTVTVDALNGSTGYDGSPWHLPAGCNDLVGDPGGSKDSLLGPGVDKVQDSTVGSPGQWGHVDGFVPGKTTWVLSTGNMTDALGDPGKVASTDLGLPGDDELTAFAGYPTYDAASYQVTLKPTGNTLHVRYVFASEEYPEYVGKVFNDVMAVWVAGKNCATVPGTTQAVSVNTVNADENSTWYVDNATGAAGYATSMDGLTKPLTCAVPVTPGQPVTVRIAVADTSDHILDSAVALVDGGIWSD